MKKLILDYVPKKSKMIYVQAVIPKDIAEEINKIRTKKHLTWNELILACLQSVIDEEREK